MIDRDTEIVSRIRARLETELGKDRFELWLGEGTSFEWADEGLRVSANTSFRLEQVRRRLLVEFRRALRQELDRDVEVTLAVDPSLGGGSPLEASTRQSEREPLASKNGRSSSDSSELTGVDGDGVDGALDPRPPLSPSTQRSPRTFSERADWSRRTTTSHSHRFAQLGTLIAGACNKMALGSVEMVIQKPGQVNPLFIHGPSGVGKSHLLEGIWSEVRRCGGRRIIYLTAEQFTTYFLQALRGSGLPSFRQKYRAVELLILDDVQFFAGKQATLTELLHTLDALLRESGQVVMAADRPSSELAMLGAEMQARISGGLVCPMHPLDLETRRALLGQLVERRQLALEDVALDRIAARTPGDARQLMGVVNRLWATRQTLTENLSLNLVEQILGELFPHGGGVIKLDDIQRVVCDEFGLDPDVLRSDRRSRSISHPRMLAMWLARKYTQAALTEIGEFFGRRSHSTVLSAKNKVEGWVTNGRVVKCDKSNCDVGALLIRLERNLCARA